MEILDDTPTEVSPPSATSATPSSLMQGRGNTNQECIYDYHKLVPVESVTVDVLAELLFRDSYCSSVNMLCEAPKKKEVANRKKISMLTLRIFIYDR